MVSLFYKKTQLYNLMLKVLHGRKLVERYQLLSSEIGKEKTVFELACGSCLITNYMDSSCKYIGWDLNKVFIEDGKKNGLNVNIHDIFDFGEYPNNDVVIIIDVLHHLVPRHHDFLKKVIDNSRKVIVIEPFKSDSFLDKLVMKTGPVRLLMRGLNRLFGDNDGINNPDCFFEWKYYENDLLSFFNEFNPRNIKKSGNDLITVFKNHNFKPHNTMRFQS